MEGLRHGCGGERDLRTAGWPQRKVAAAWVRRPDQRETRVALRAALVAAWREGGLDRVRALASMQMKLEASLLHLPPTSIPRTTRRHRLLFNSSG